MLVGIKFVTAFSMVGGCFAGWRGGGGNFKERKAYAVASMKNVGREQSDGSAKE